MPPLILNKKLKPAKRAWKSLSNRVKSKLEKLEISEFLRRIKSQVSEFFSHRLFHPFKIRFLRKSQPRSHYCKYNQVYRFQLQSQIEPRNEFAAMYNDDGEESMHTIEDAWRAVVAASPHLRPVDERADEFIHKFREEMKIDKEKSLLEFQEMLRRGA